jgi:hypothetical protein
VRSPAIGKHKTQTHTFMGSTSSKCFADSYDYLLAYIKLQRRCAYYLAFYSAVRFVIFCGHANEINTRERVDAQLSKLKEPAPGMTDPI